MMRSREVDVMTGKNGKEQTKERSDLYKKNGALWVRVNLYLIRNMYKYVKRENDVLESGTYNIHDWEPTRQRLAKVNNGSGFSLQEKEKKLITQTFGIDKKYFNNYEQELIPIEGISYDDWKLFFGARYYVTDLEIDKDEFCLYKGYELGDEEIKNLPDEFHERNKIGDVEKISKKMVETLKGIAYNWRSKTKKGEPLHRICHYYCYGDAERDIQNIDELKKYLSITRCRDWERETLESLRENITYISKHYKYVEALITVREENEKK